MQRRSLLLASLALAACRRAQDHSEPAEALPPGLAVRELSFPGAISERTLVIHPEPASRDEPWPMLIALHGRGEAVRGAEAGAYGWFRDYRLSGAVTALQRGRLTSEDLQGHVDAPRVAALDRALAARKYRGLVVVCPHTPDLIGRGLDAADGFGAFLVDQLVPRVRAELPVTSAIGIDGVSLGGRVALLAGAAHPETFAAIGTLQAAIRENEAPELATRLSTWSRARGSPAPLRLLTSDGDPFAPANAALDRALTAAGVTHEHVVTVGPHDYSFNRGPGGIEMLLFHDRVLRGEPSLLPRSFALEHPSLLPLARTSDALRKVGGKVAALARAAKKGAPVPPSWVLDADPFRDLVETRLPPGHDPYSVIKISRELVRIDRAARARDLVLDAMLPEGLLLALSNLLRELLPHAPHGLAVRGSPTITDDTSAVSGLGKAVLGVRTERELHDAVRTVWAATYLPRSLDHFQRRGVKDVAMAVLVQPMLLLDVTGVLVTEPGTRGERLVTAALGFGSPVEHGAAAYDAVRLDASGAILEARIADKRRVLRLGAHGVIAEDARADDVRAPALSAARCHALAELARKLDGAGIGPCHATYAFAGDALWLLEAQVDAPRGHIEGGEATSVWSRATVGESLPSVLSPLGWSLTDGFVETSVRKALDTLGCSLPRGSRVLANVHGRVYANVSAVLRGAAQLPGLDPAMLTALAGRPAQEIAELKGERARATAFARLPVTAARLLSLQTTIAREVAAFEESCTDAWRLLGDLDLAILPDDALVPTLRDARTLLDRTSELIGSTTTTHVASHLLLGTLLLRAFPESAASMALAITGSAGQLPSAQPALELSRVADVARVDPDAARALLERRALPAGPTARALDGFLELHGDHVLREGELSLPRWRETPAPVLAMLAALIASPGGVEGRPTAQRRQTEAWATVEHRVPFLELGLVRALAARGRLFAELRDRVGICHTRVLGMVRTVVREVDRRLRRVDASLTRGAAFFCTYDELCVALGTGKPDVAHLVRLRRAEDARDRDVADPPPRFTGAPVLLPPLPTGAITLNGVGASGGTGEGAVRIVRDDDDAAAVRAGDVLVLRSADAALSPLFPLAAAVVAELGGPLGHGSVVARELGVPAVVHAFGATTTLREGERVRVDGDTGAITRLGAA